MGNPFCHVELTTTDMDKAKSFYSGLFDWNLQDVPMGPGGSYTLIGVGKDKAGCGGGMMSMPGAPTAWMAYVLVDDVKASTEKARSLGATIVKDVMEVPGAGWMSIITDPGGATLGLWEANPNAQQS